MVTNHEVSPIQIAITCICCLLPVSVVFFLMPPIGIVLIPVICLVLLMNRSTRRHGWIFLVAIVYFLCDAYLCYRLYGGGLWEMWVFGGIGLWANRFLPDLVVIFGGVWFILIFPILASELLFWAVRHKKWTELTITAVLILVIAGLSRGYVTYCTDNFKAAYALRGQTMTAQELFQRCGKPLLLNKKNKPRWIYTNGSQMLSAFIEENDMVRISDQPYPYLDL